MNTDWRILMAPAAAVLHVGTFVLGACIGSFLNVVIWRIPRGESLISPPSKCPKCGHRIKPWENIPVLSWLLLRGKCANCHNPIAIRYPLVELLTAFFFLIIWLNIWKGDQPLAAAFNLATAAAILVAAAFTDIDHRIIPNKITYFGIAAGIALTLIIPAARPLAIPAETTQWTMNYPRLTALADILATMLATLLITMAIRKTGELLFLPHKSTKKTQTPSEALGLGDVKLLIAMTALLGFEPLVFILLIASIIGFIFGICRSMLTKSKDSTVRFAPFLALAAFIWIWQGNTLKIMAFNVCL